MTLHSARIETKKITDWASFHAVFAETLGFPGFYGRNLNAWIECMANIDDGMTRFTVAPGELFHLEVADTKDFAKRLPEIYQALIEVSACVNRGRVEVGEQPILALVLL